MTVYSLNCSVCNEQFSKGQSWLRHLTKDKHLNVARKKWDPDDTVKGSCLIVYTTHSLTKECADKVIEYFSDQTTLVTDFVWWEDRPKMAIVQFESKSKVKGIFNPMKDPPSQTLQIGNQRVQVKAAFHMLEFEWKSIIPTWSNRNRPPPARCELARQCSKKTKRTRHSNELSSESSKICNLGPQVAPGPPPKRVKVLPPPFPLPPPNKHDASVIFSPVDKLSPYISKCSPNSLRHQFWSIRQSVIIPTSYYKYNESIGIVDAISKLFRLRRPDYRVAIFRNWHLKLRHPTRSHEDDHLMIYVYSDNLPAAYFHSYSYLPEYRVNEIFEGPAAQEEFELLSGGSVHGWQIKYKRSDIPIHLFTYTGIMVEVQVCRLLKYLCLFDPRFHPLLTLVHYWVYKNDIPFSASNSPRKGYMSFLDPLNLQWLVVHFMCYRKYIPTPRKIQERPHEVLNDRLTGTDVGFFADLGYVREWRSMKQGSEGEEDGDQDCTNEDFVLGVVQLFLEFLEFCLSLEDGNYIFNTRDGEVININQFLNSKPGDGWTTKMTEGEVAQLEAMHRPSKPVTLDQDSLSPSATEINDEDGSQQIQQSYFTFTDFTGWKFYMTQPFILRWKFSMPRDIPQILSLMKNTTVKLKTYLRDNDGVGQMKHARNSLQNVLTVDRTEWLAKLVLNAQY